MSIEPEPSVASEAPRPAVKWTRLLPIVLFLVALLIRLPGIGWGLKNDLHNQSYHPDETMIWSWSQAIDPTSLSFTPGKYNYGTVYLTMLRVAGDVTAAYTGGYDIKNPDSVWSYASRVHMAGRILSTFAGAGTVLVLFLLLRRRIGDLGATMGALLIAVAPGHVMHSRFQTVDVVATFFLALSALFALRLLDRAEEDSGVKDAVLAGLFAGLSAGTKYTGVLAILTLLAVLALARRKHLVKEGAIGIVVAAATFVVVTPGVLLDFQNFWRDFRFEMAHTSTGHGIVFMGTPSGFIYHLGNLLVGVGAVLTLMGLVGLAYFAWRKQVWILALLAFFIPYYVLIGRAEVKFLRYTFPMYVALAAGFGALMAKSHQKKGWGHAVVALGIVGLGGLDSRGLLGTAQDTALMMGEDPRDQAVRWLRAQAGPTTAVGLAEDPWYWNPPLAPNATSMRMGPGQRPEWLAELRATSKPPMALVVDANGYVTSFNPQLVEQGPEYITFSSLESDPRERLSGRKDVPKDGQAEADRYLDFMKALSQTYSEQEQARFGSQARLVEDMQYIHPVVMIWKRKATP